MKKLRPSYYPAIIWFIIVTVLLVLPGSSLPNEHWDWMGKIHFDKWVHFGMFAGLVFLCCWAMLVKRPKGPGLLKPFIWLALAGTAYGVAMEFVQKYFIPGRDFEVGDMLADAAGCGVALVYCIRTYTKK